MFSTARAPGSVSIRSRGARPPKARSGRFCHLVVYVSANCRTLQVETSALRVLDTGPYRAALDAWPLNTESIAAWAHCSPCPLETPIAPITWPFTTIGSAPGCGKSFMNVGARFSPLRTILFVSDVGRRHRNADLAFSRAVRSEERRVG